MDYGMYIHKLVQSFRDNRSNRYMFIKHYDTLLISEKELHDIVVDETSMLTLLFYEFPMHRMQGPYSPFLEWIRELYYHYFSDESPEEFVEHAGVYALQREMFVSYIKNNIAHRTEDIFLKELRYERDRMLQSLVSVYLYMSKKKQLFIFLEKLHLANASCVMFLTEFIRRANTPEVQILGLYNEIYRTSDYIASIWKKFVDELEKRNLQYEWSSINTETTVDVKSAFLPKVGCIEEYLTHGANMYFFLAVEDANHYLSVIYEWLKEDANRITEEHVAIFYTLYSLVLMLKGDYTTALQMCEYVGAIGRQNDDEQAIYQYNYLLAMCQYGTLHSEDKVAPYVEVCKKIAKKNGDELALVKLQVLQVLSKYGYWKDVFEKRYRYQMADEFIEKTEKFGLRNMQAHFYIYSFEVDQDTMKAMVAGKKMDSYFDKGVKIATELDNRELLMSAYTKVIVSFSEEGYHSVVEEFYKKKLEIMDEGTQLVRKIHVYNGLGHNYGVMEKYNQAEEYFERSLRATLEIKDGLELAITLYNSSVNKMLAREFGLAVKDLDLLLHVMSILHMQSITLCDTSRIYGMLGFCCFYMGEQYRCYLCLNHIEAYVRHLDYVEDEDKYKYWHDTLFFRCMIRAMLAVDEERYEDAEKEFAKAKLHMTEAVGNQYFNYPLYVVELSRYYDKLGKERERKEILEEGIDFCNQRNFHLRENLLLHLWKNKVEKNTREQFPVRSISDQEILEGIEDLATEREVEVHQKDINCILVLQDLLNQKLSLSEMSARAMKQMKNYFSFDGIFMIDIQNEEPYISQKDIPKLSGGDTSVTEHVMNFTQEDMKKIISYFNRYKRTLFINRIDKGFMEYAEITEMFDIHHVVTLYAYPLMNPDGIVQSVLVGYVEMKKNYLGHRYLLQDHDYIILDFFSKQLYIALERLAHLELINRMNSQLSDMAITDLLTGLYNRQGFEQRVSEDMKESKGQHVLIYADLDNFKYYNDTFGHELGDFVLVRFAQLLDTLVDGNGYAVRFGGDEFVVVLDDKDLEYGKLFAKNIVFRVADKLNNDILKQIGYSMRIPEEKQLSCSIGIATFQDQEDINEALNKADKGLYHIKRGAKNGYVVWDELIECK